KVSVGIASNGKPNILHARSFQKIPVDSTDA
ncbi:MAG: hypothetical protein ACI945_001732, partial [Pseudohongiellaceae bacterium]